MIPLWCCATPAPRRSTPSPGKRDKAPYLTRSWPTLSGPVGSTTRLTYNLNQGRWADLGRDETTWLRFCPHWEPNNLTQRRRAAKARKTNKEFAPWLCLARLRLCDHAPLPRRPLAGQCGPRFTGTPVGGLRSPRIFADSAGFEE